MKKIKVHCLDGYYYVEDGYLCYSCPDLQDDVEVTDLSDTDLLEFFNFIEQTQDLTTVVYNEWKTSIWGMWEEYNNCFLNLEAK